MVICVKCGRECVTDGGATAFVGWPDAPRCLECFYQTPEGREWVERGRRLAAGLPLDSPSPAAKVTKLAEARRRHVP